MNNSSSKAHRGVQHSTTLNRKYVKRPVVAAKKPAITSIAKQQSEAMKRRQVLAEKINRERLAALKAKSKSPAPAKTQKVSETTSTTPESVVRHPVESTVRTRLALKRAKPIMSKSLTMHEKKDQAIESALRSVSTMEKKGEKAPKMKNRSFFTFKRVALALGCSTLAVGAIAFFVNLSMPDLSVRVTAIQTGVDAIYPSYIPRGYSLASVMSEEGKVIMVFSTTSGDSFSLTEEKSSWDSSALESNYVKSTFSDYVPIREQGLTLYISGSDCAWVNGGKVFVIDASGDNLSKKQLKSIAVSL